MFISILEAGGFTLAVIVCILCIYKLSVTLRSNVEVAKPDHSAACLAAAMDTGISNYHVWTNRLVGTDANNEHLLLLDYNQSPAMEYHIPVSTIENVVITEQRSSGSNYLERTGWQLRMADGSTIEFTVYDKNFDIVTDMPRLTRFTMYFKRFLVRLLRDKVSPVRASLLQHQQASGTLALTDPAV